MMVQTYPSVLNYSNRQIDVELLQSILKPNVDPQRVNVALVTKGTKIVAGMEKLVQRYALLLLTIQGGVHFDQTFGTTLMADISNGVIQNKGSLMTSFSLANVSVVKLMREEDSLTDVYGTPPADEQLQNATLQDANIDVATGTVYLKVSLTTQAGSNMVFVIPTTTPR